MATPAAGLAALALFVLVLGYWVPLRVRQRQELAEARTEDRFSAGLRVLAVAASGPVPAVAGATTGAVPAMPVAGLLERAADPLPIKVPPPLDARTRAREESPMAPPQPAARPSRRVLLEARARRARRRLVLTLVLTLATAAAWVAVASTSLPWYAAAVPSVLLVVVLGLGRAASAAARRADARYAAEQRAAERRALQARALAAGGPRAPMNRARVTGRAVRGSSAMTTMLPRVEVTVVEGELAEPAPAAETPDAAAEASTSSGDARAATPAPAPSRAWEPRPVPLPTYVTKPAAPRREPRPLTGATPTAVSTGWSSSPLARVDDRGDEVGEATTSWSLGATQAAALGPTTTPAPATAASSAETVDPVATPEPRPKTETLGLPLEQILARRRAAG